MSVSDAEHLRGIKYRTIHKELFAHLGSLIQKEVQHGGQPAFKVWEGKGTQCVETFRTEMALYARGQYLL